MSGYSSRFGLGVLMVTIMAVVWVSLSDSVSASGPLRWQQTPVPTPVTPIPPEAPLATNSAGDDILNILLLGSDTTNPVNAGRTDAIMIVSLNRTHNTVNLLSIPRDLFIYVPDGTMQRINTVFGEGERSEIEGGGYALLEQVILYNLGITIDFYARVDFVDFKHIIDALGGVELTVDCALQDWQLKSPELDPMNEENWELVTLPVGVHMLDGDEALWYARSRRTSSDFDRGRRQQDLVRAIWQRVKTLGILNQLPVLWDQVARTVETDMGLEDMLGLVPMALALDASRVAHFRFEPGIEARGWRTPAGAAVQLPVPVAVEALVQRFMQPHTDNQLVSSQRVALRNATGYRNMDRVAADLLGWEGFGAVAAGDDISGYRARSVVYDYTGRTKGSQLEALLAALHLEPGAVVQEPRAERDYDYLVVLGGDYRSCQHSVMPPVATPIPESG